MRKTILASLAAVTLVSGCARVQESRINPFNWFGPSQERRVEDAFAQPAPVVVDTRPIVRNVQQVRIDPAPGGAIVTAVGLPDTQGYWSAELRPATSIRSNVLLFDFVLIPPPSPQPAGTVQSREVTAATFVRNETLAGVSTITVRGSANSRSSGR